MQEDIEKELDANKQKASLSTKLQDLLENEELTKSMIKTHPQWMQHLADASPSSVIAGNLIASALGGDKKAIELIQKIAYGDHVTIDTAPGFFDTKDITITIVDPKHKDMNLDEPS